ncbi:TrkA family potassium uptake protein [Methylomarinum sp. Ch1-1]|uniref:Trk system potassium uptake protein TrkA n=1 Tax=Methylomarinum roseum TaxID=3067653 RepID=A0AAU7NZ35_9GAMM|nr:TrkA family potassium uptake protein [Methylomarinum sp. Ch1-1]MDP4521662.1 TrkA family potassium uptake protein [Methylomarinum sp. Ch1-1]
MKVVFIGASSLAVATAKLLLLAGHEVIIIETDKAVIDELMESLDCVFVHGNGSKPAILKETEPTSIDILFCLTKSDEANIIASLVARSLGFKRVIIRIEDPEFEHICVELGLNDTIIPTLTNARYLANIAAGRNILELSAVIRGNVRLFNFVVDEADEGPIEELDLPKQSRVIFLYRDNVFQPTDADTELKKGDEVVLVTTTGEYEKLHAKWSNGKVK